MTTKVTVENEGHSTRVVRVRTVYDGGAVENEAVVLLPGQSHEVWLHATNRLEVTEGPLVADKGEG